MQPGELTVSHLASVMRIAADSPKPEAALQAVTELALTAIGCKGCTIFRYIDATAEVERIYSSNLASYPLGGRKAISAYPVNQAVLAKGEIYVAQDRAGVTRTYKDFEKIFAMGVTSIMNVPVRHAGRNLGALNCFGEEGWFDADRQARGRIVAGLLVPTLLAWNS